MSPIKRALSLRYGEELASPKRLRGGGPGEDDDDDDVPCDAVPPHMDEDDELFDDDLAETTEEIPDEVLEQAARDIPESAQQRWKRPALPADFSNGQDLNLQWIDMDVVTGNPLEKHPNSAKTKISGSRDGKVPVLRCYGVDDRGHSVACFMHGFSPYAYFALPPNADFDDSVNENDAMGKIREMLDIQLKSAARVAAQLPHAVLGLKFVRDHKSIFGYDTPHSKFLIVYVALPGMVAPLKRIMEGGIRLPAIVYAPNDGLLAPVFAAYECNVPFVLRFMVDRGITGAGWLTLPANTYSVRDTRSKETHCQVCHSDLLIVAVRNAHLPIVLMLLFLFFVGWNRSKSTSSTTTLFHESLKTNGTKSLLYAFFLWISSVRVVKAIFQRPRKILSSRLPTCYPYTASSSRLFRMFLL